MKRVFCIGNGESRKDIDLEKLRSHGKIYGCNALYRDFTPDVLVAVDQGIMHEIYHSGYPYNNECYFRNWSKVPAELYENMIKAGATDEDILLSKQENIILENKREDDTNEFVMHGSTVAGMATIIRKNKSRDKKQIYQNSIKISWIKDKDKSNCLNDILTQKDPGWAAGPISGAVAAIKEKPDEIYMIGHDLNSKTKYLNNLYKNTSNYGLSDRGPIPSDNWLQQWKQLFRDNPKVKFIKVNENMSCSDAVNRPMLEWDGTVKNLDYMVFKDFYKKFNIK
jgi:hypothetical protein